MSSFPALFGMLLLASGVLAWQALRAMHERALAIAQKSCREASLQLLDATVALQRVGMARAEGRLGVQLDYSFDVSADGQHRGQGRLRFHGGVLLWIEMPRADNSRDLWVVSSKQDG